MSKWCEWTSEWTLGRILDDPILPFLAALKTLFVSYVKYHNKKEKLFRYKQCCPLQIMLTSHSAKGCINSFQRKVSRKRATNWGTVPVSHLKWSGKNDIYVSVEKMKIRLRWNAGKAPEMGRKSTKMGKKQILRQIFFAFPTYVCVWGGREQHLSYSIIMVVHTPTLWSNQLPSKMVLTGAGNEKTRICDACF